MADTLVPQTPPKKLFKPSNKTKTPSRSQPSPQLTQQTESGRRTFHRVPRSVASAASVASVASDSTERMREQSLDSIAKSTRLAPLTNVSDISDGPAGGAGSDTTGDTRVGLIDNYVSTPADTASRSTGARSPLSRRTSQSAKGPSSNFKDRLSRAGKTMKEPVDGLLKNITGKPTDGVESAASSPLASAGIPTDIFNSPTDIAKYFRDHGHPEMGHFVASLAGHQSPDSCQNTHSAIKSPVDEKTRSPDDRGNETTSDGKNDTLDSAEQRQGSQRGTDPSPPNPTDISKTAEGTFRDSEGSESMVQPTNNMGEPNVSDVSQAAQPVIPSANPDGKKQPTRPSPPSDKAKDTHMVDNMGKPVRVERSIEIPFQRSGRGAASPLSIEKQRAESRDLGDVKDLPSTENLPSTDDLPDIPEADSQDPPEEILDPAVHSTTPASITPIPKIPKIAPIDSSPPIDLPRLAKGLAGYVIDDVGNIVDESGDEVLGHATGDLPAMVGKTVSDNGEVYGDGGEIIGYVSENFVNPPSPTEIPRDLLGRLRVDHKGNILDSDGHIIGKFNQPPAKSSGKPSSPETEPKEEQKPKVNAHTGGSPSDLFLDVKSTTDGIQLTIRIPTTFSRPPPESQ